MLHDVPLTAHWGCFFLGRMCFAVFSLWDILTRRILIFDHRTPLLHRLATSMNEYQYSPNVNRYLFILTTFFAHFIGHQHRIGEICPACRTVCAHGSVCFLVHSSLLFMV